MPPRRTHRDPFGPLRERHPPPGPQLLNLAGTTALRPRDGRLPAALERTARCVQNRARLVQALYARLDRLTEPLPAAT
ncbi:hypothetical protein [Streptomyces sp. NPDC088246]|uniref:hypothetical protein n=1 Tax=Streptomyces sp. NPDC088246 TaxID=3365842 RepID=UPI0037F85B99